MRAIKNEFPNPVLAKDRDDYIESCCFYTTLEENDIVVGKENISIPIKYSLECEGLKKLLESEDAVVIVIVKSSAASFSRLYRFPLNDTKTIVEIPKYSVVNKIEITGFIVAANNIDNFNCPGEFNDLYFGSMTFEIRKGDILATEDSRIIYVDDSELEKPISSIFYVSESNEISSDIFPDFNDHKITIYLKKNLYDLYYALKDFNNGSLRRYTIGIIVYPVLVEAITYVIGYYQNKEDDSSGGQTYSDYRWFRTIVKKAEEAQIDLHTYADPVTSLADRLLGEISLDALKSFKDTLDREMDSGETQILGGID